MNIGPLFDARDRGFDSISSNKKQALGLSTTTRDHFYWLHSPEGLVASLPIELDTYIITLD
jgi:hypothetical protein